MGRKQPWRPISLKDHVADEVLVPLQARFLRGWLNAQVRAYDHAFGLLRSELQHMYKAIAALDDSELERRHMDLKAAKNARGKAIEAHKDRVLRAQLWQAYIADVRHLLQNTFHAVFDIGLAHRERLPQGHTAARWAIDVIVATLEGNPRFFPAGEFFEQFLATRPKTEGATAIAREPLDSLPARAFIDAVVARAAKPSKTFRNAGELRQEFTTEIEWCLNELLTDGEIELARRGALPGAPNVHELYTLIHNDPRAPAMIKGIYRPLVHEIACARKFGLSELTPQHAISELFSVLGQVERGLLVSHIWGGSASTERTRQRDRYHCTVL